MKKFQFAVLLLCISALSTYSQTEDYKLDSYVNPDYKRQSLDFNFEGDGFLTSFKSTGLDYSTDWDDQKISGNLSLGYNLIKNSEKVQSRINSKLLLSGNYYNEKSIGNINKQYSIGFNFDNQAYYYLKDKKFIEFSPHISFYINDNRNDTVTSDDPALKRFNVNLNLSFFLGVGKGRIEHVEDARQAMYILSDLQKNKSLKKTLNQDEINAFAQQMTSIKQKRQFDSRIKLIQEISTVDSFLVANNYIDPTNSAPYFTSLYDNWQYAGLIERLSGTRFSVGLTPQHHSNHNEYNYIYDSGPYTGRFTNSMIQGGAYVSYEYEKPVNLYWQRSASIVITESYGKRSEEVDPFWRTNLNGSFKMGYYPNSRTYMTGSISQYLNYEDVFDRLSSNSRLSFDIYYYLSPQLRLMANCGLNYSYNKLNYMDGKTYSHFNKYPDFSFNFGLTYSIF